MSANPDTKDGYLKIANELQEAFCKLKSRGEEYQVLDAIKRLTYGYNHKTAYIRPKAIIELTDLLPAAVSRAKKALFDKNVLYKDKDGNVGIQTNYLLWVSNQRAKPEPKPLVPEKAKPKKAAKVDVTRHQYGEFKNVLLSDKEHDYLVNKYGEASVRTLIEEVGLYEKTHKKGYKSFQGAIITFARNADKNGDGNGRNRKAITKRAGQPSDYKEVQTWE